MHRTKAERRRSEWKAKKHQQQIAKIKKQEPYRKGHDDIPDWDLHWASGLSMDAIGQRLDAEENQSRREVLPRDAGPKSAEDIRKEMAAAKTSGKKLQDMADSASPELSPDDWDALYYERLVWGDISELTSDYEI